MDIFQVADYEMSTNIASLKRNIYFQTRELGTLKEADYEIFIKFRKYKNGGSKMAD